MSAARTRAGRKRPYTKGDTAVATTSHVMLTVWSVIVIVPFLWTLLSSFKTSKQILSSPFSLPDKLHFENYVNAWNTAGIGQFFFNTVIVVGSALVLVMLLGAMLAYVLARFKFPGNGLIYNVMLAAMSFPIFLAIVPLFFILKNFMILDTLPGLIITYVAFALPFTMFFLYAFFKQLPQDIYEAAVVDGAGEWRTFFQVMLPMSTPGMASVAILNFLGLWNQFLLPLVLNPSKENWVLSQGMASFASKAGYAVDFGSLFAAAVITIIPVLVIYVIFQQRLQGSVSQGTFR
ncbi:MAG: carbohydrate ABC transporter permease [Bifidobacteriaceae bacterium]|jgi:N-acetylglucosamine transport system permease protein|nr:carbohydrate ABC transporter permease [Bifidobacteriaceae bacterium]